MNNVRGDIIHGGTFFTPTPGLRRALGPNLPTDDEAATEVPDDVLEGGTAAAVVARAARISC